MRSDLTGLHPEALERLREASGLTLVPGEPLAAHTTLRVGGPAELFARVGDQASLALLLEVAGAHALPFHLLGLGSNLLVPDEGLAGIVARLEGEFERFRIEGCRVEAGAGLPLARLAHGTLAEGLVGLEALSGFPSTVGGAVIMNAGCYGVEIKDVLEEVQVMRADGRVERLGVAQLAARYRSTALQGSGSVVTTATFRLRREDPAPARARLAELNRRRWRSMPSGRPNAGSIFRNPPGDSAGRLIDACGLKGQRRGDAEISVEHANVIVNLGNASAADILELMLEARAAVEATFGIGLEPEVVLVGSLRRRWRAAIGSG